VLYLHAVAPFVPEHSVAIEDLRVPLGLSDGEFQLLTRFLGLERIAVAEGLTTSDMLLAAGEQALAGTDRSRVAYLIHAHAIGHVAPPVFRLAHSLREKLGLTEARAFALSHQSCVAGLYGLKVAETLLRAEPAGATALILAGEKIFSPLVRHLPGTSITGDAAAAVLVGLDGPGDAVIGRAHRTLGEFYRSRDLSPRQQRRYHHVYVATLASVIRDAVADAGLDLEDIRLVLPHNVNRFSWVAAAAAVPFPLDRVYLENIPKFGHCYCCDPFVNLSTARAQGAAGPGDPVLLVSGGQGATFGAAVIRIADEPRRHG
jgi:3-oxoacyl-[acyl-carrier-protein] synthase-3